MCDSTQESMTAEAVCERLCRRQFEEGQDIFAVQWSSIHRMAQTGDMRGLRQVGLPSPGHMCCRLSAHIYVCSDATLRCRTSHTILWERFRGRIHTGVAMCIIRNTYACLVRAG